jgi:hypothetical protein
MNFEGDNAGSPLIRSVLICIPLEGDGGDWGPRATVTTTDKVPRAAIHPSLEWN